MGPSRRRCPLGFHAHCDEVALSVLCPWGGGVFDLLEAGFAARAIACWGCLGRAMRDSSSGVEHLRIPRGRKSESAVVLAFVVPVILTSLRPRYETSKAPVGLAWAYGDVLKGTQAVLSVVRHARELRTLLIRVP
ncbi:hypothetical protein CDL15_Pgr003950 [Punica granatum]|uniref:Uncharacterized protein n=1 Tax=Punica granatum TaxID=22663 RepID=A0A218WNL4_PUNGR|nr:hypothetical protein CDL15_Pgr003950 [Punica granatum]